MQKQVTVIGGLNMDIKAKSNSRLRTGDSNPSTIEIAAGGVARNIAHNLSLLGVPTTLLSAAGLDNEGRSIIQQTAEAGVNTDSILLTANKSTGKYIAILDEQGEMALAVSDMDILHELTVDYLESKLAIIKSSSFVVCDTNLDVPSLRYVAEACRTFEIPLCIDPVSSAKSLRLQGLLEGIHLLTPNARELAALTGVAGDIEKAAQKLTAQGVKNVITTLGEDGICHTDKNKSTRYPSIAKCVVDVTGAGDSLTAGLIYGLLSCDSFQYACRCGLAAAAITLSSKETVSSSMSIHQIQRLITGL